LRRLSFLALFVIEIFASENPDRQEKNDGQRDIVYRFPPSFQIIAYYSDEKTLVRAFPVRFRIPERRENPSDHPMQNPAIPWSVPVYYPMRPKELPFELCERIVV